MPPYHVASHSSSSWLLKTIKRDLDPFVTVGHAIGRAYDFANKHQLQPEARKALIWAYKHPSDVAAGAVVASLFVPGLGEAELPALELVASAASSLSESRNFGTGKDIQGSLLEHK